MLLGKYHLEDSHVSLEPPTPKDVPALLCIPSRISFEYRKLILKCWEFFHVRSAEPQKMVGAWVYE